MMASVASAAAQASGLPPKVEPWLPGLKSSRRRPGREARADRHAVAESLGERHHVGHDARVLEREPLAGAAHAALHLVEHEQPAVRVADLAQALRGSRRGRR